MMEMVDKTEKFLKEKREIEVEIKLLKAEVDSKTSIFHLIEGIHKIKIFQFQNS